MAGWWLSHPGPEKWWTDMDWVSNSWDEMIFPIFVEKIEHVPVTTNQLYPTTCCLCYSLVASVASVASLCNQNHAETTELKDQLD